MLAFAETGAAQAASMHPIPPHEFRRRLDKYGVFDKQLFPDLDGIAKWLKYRAYEINGTI